jgi:hypothetical protein
VNSGVKSSNLRSLTSARYTIIALLAILLGAIGVGIALAGTPLDVVGYLDFSYGSNVKERPTAEKPESKLWWNDGIWWGVLYNRSVGEFRIYRLNESNQTWEDTGTTVDEREDSRADVLWDGEVNKLYIASHFRFSNPAHTSNDAEKGRLYRYTYNQSTKKYSLDNGFPVNVNSDKTETLVLDKDSTGRLWVTYVSRDTLTPSDFIYVVFVNTSADDGLTWGTPFIVPVVGKIVDLDDISSLIAFQDDGGDKVGIMWSNQVDGHYYFATHDDAQAPGTGWTLETVDTSPYTIIPNDHINLARTASGQVFAAIRTNNVVDTDPLIALVARDTDGSYSFHVFSDVDSKDTRPIVLVHEDKNKIYMFVSSNPLGGRICYKSADIPANLSQLNIPEGNCQDLGYGGASQFMADTHYTNINDPTSTKQIVSRNTGLVVLASDDMNGKVYLHNLLGEDEAVFLPIIMK